MLTIMETPVSIVKPPAKFFNVAGYKVAINTLSGIYPYFITEARQRMKNKQSLNIVITGEAGVSKTYTAAHICKLLNPRFGIEQTVMTFKEYMTEILHKGRVNIPILFDEPQYALDKRDWYNDVNKALIKTITSQRFRRRPLVIPIINQSLLDVNLRKYLLNYHIIMNNRGKGVAYRMQASQVEDKIYRKRICTVNYGLMDYNQCSKDSCLGCNTLNKKNGDNFVCNLWRSEYERKKAETVNNHDKESLQDIEKMGTKQITDAELLKLLEIHRTEVIRKFNTRGKISLKYNHGLVAMKVEELTNLTLGANRAHKLTQLLTMKHPINQIDTENTKNTKISL